MEPRAANWNDLKIRTMSAAAFALLVFVCLWFGNVVFACLVILAAILMMKEWQNLVERESHFFRLAGYPYIILPCACILWLRNISTANDPALGFKIVLTLIAVISATDIGAYFTGKKFGYTKLWPAISPNKTWEGVAGGIAAATAAGILCTAYLSITQSFLATLLLSPLISVVAQIGDLFKSWIKRRAGVKDSGHILPGHGGLLDRLDGYMFAAPLLAVIICLALKDTL